MASNKYGYMAKIGVDTTGMKNADKEINALDRELKAVDKVIKENGESAEMLAQRDAVLAEKTKVLTNKLEELRKIEVKVRQEADPEYVRQFERELANVEGQLKSLNHTAGETEKTSLSLSDVVKSQLIAGAFEKLISAAAKAGQKLLEFGQEGIALASNLQEVQNVVDVTFGSDNSKIYDFADTAAEKFGLAKLSAEQYAGTMGALLKSSGITEGIDDMAISIAGLAADMASFYNIPFDTAFEKIRSGMAGETEPLKQLGINMSVVNLEAFAMSQGIEKSWKSMSQAEQTMLRYNYLMAQTADAQGDFARTSDSLANQQRILELNMQNVKARMGDELLPVMQQFISALNDGLPDIASMLAEGADPARAKEIMDGFAEELLGGLDEITRIIQESGGNVRDLLAGIGDGTSELAHGAVDVIAVFCEEIVRSLPAMTDVAFRIIEGLAEGIADALPTLTPAAVEALVGIVESIADNLSMVVDVAVDIINGLAEGIGLALPMLLQKAPEIILKLETALIESVPRLMNISNEIGENIRKGLAEYDWEAGAREAVEGIREAMLDYLAAYGGTYARIGRQIIKQLNSGITPEDISAGAGTTSGTWDLQESLWDEAEELEEAAARYGTMSKTAAQFMADNAKRNAGIAEESRKARLNAQRELTNAEMERLEGELAKHNISDNDYWEQRKAYLEAHRDEESAEWWEYYDEVTAHYDKLAETERKAADDAAKQLEKDKQDRYSRLKENAKNEQTLGGYGDEWYFDRWEQIIRAESDGSDFYLKEMDKLAVERKKAADKRNADELKEWQTSAEASKKAIDKAYDDIEKSYEKSYEDMNKHISDLVSKETDKDGRERIIFGDLKEENKKLDRYNNSLDKLKNTGISDTLMSELMKLNYDDGTRQAYIDELLGMSEKKREQYYRDYEAYQKKVQESANAQIADEINALDNIVAENVNSIFGNMPAAAYESGAETALQFMAGLSENLAGYDSMLEAMGIGTKKAGSQVTVSPSSPAAVSMAGGAYSTGDVVFNINNTEVMRMAIADFIRQINLGGGMLGE